MKLRVLRGNRTLRSIRLRETQKKLRPLLPNFFTVGNLAAGLAGILLALQGQVWIAAWMVGLSMVFDALDGRIARWLKIEGEFGKEMDSLADLVSFGVLPALLMYEVNLKSLGYYGWAIMMLFPICGALRLARFNILKVSGYFLGLPITAAGGLVASFIVYGRKLDSWVFPFLTLAIAYLMVSTIRYPDFKKSPHGRLKILPILIPAVAVVLTLRVDPKTIIFLPLLLYAASGVYLHFERGWTNSVVPRLRWLAVKFRGY